MSIKLDTLSDWKRINGSIGLLAATRRRVKIYLNCEDVTPFYIVVDGGEASFLTTVPYGLSTLEFWAEGNLEIAPATADAMVHWQATEDDEFTFDGTGETFTTIHERQPRNEALEYMMYQQELNQKRMQDALRSEFSDKLASLKEQYEGSSGVHGSAAAQHQEPQGAAAPASGAAAPVAVPQANLAGASVGGAPSLPDTSVKAVP